MSYHVFQVLSSQPLYHCQKSTKVSKKSSMSKEVHTQALLLQMLCHWPMLMPSATSILPYSHRHKQLLLQSISKVSDKKYTIIPSTYLRLHHNEQSRYKNYLSEVSDMAVCISYFHL